MSGNRPHQCRHLWHDDQRAARDRRLYLAGQGRDVDREKWWKMGKPMDRRRLRHRSPIVPGCGDKLSENRKRVRILWRHQRLADRMFKSNVTGLPLPARAEIILEGFVYPDETFAEGPFGEFRLLRPAERRDALCASKNPLPQQPDTDLRADGRGPANEAGCSGRRCARRRSGPICTNRHTRHSGRVVIPEAAGWGITVVSIKQMYPGHAPQAMALAAQCTAAPISASTSSSSMIASIQPTCIRCCGRWRHGHGRRSRSTSARDLEHVSRSEPQSAGNPAVGIKGADQCLHGLRHIKNFSKRTKLSKATYDQVVSRWNELGFSGQPPVQTVFEDAAPGSSVG